jgi:acetyl esterase/lipase
VLISPVLDASFSNPTIGQVAPKDPWLGRPGLRAAADLWRANLPIEDMLVSPLFADLSALGPLTIFSGTRDITNPDTRAFVSKARKAGVEVEYHEAADLVHVYPLLPIPEGKRARQAIIEAVRGPD